jgi:hypothetical protein
MTPEQIRAAWELHARRWPWPDFMRLFWRDIMILAGDPKYLTLPLLNLEVACESRRIGHYQKGTSKAGESISAYNEIDY